MHDIVDFGIALYCIFFTLLLCIYNFCAQSVSYFKPNGGD